MATADTPKVLPWGTQLTITNYSKIGAGYTKTECGSYLYALMFNFVQTINHNNCALQ